MKYKTFTLMLVLLISNVVSFSSVAQTDEESLNQPNQQELYSPSVEYSSAQLAQMLAPIALYPDSLLTHILIAATYPLEIVQADRWLKKQGNISTSQIEKRSADKGWDASVKALLPFANVVSKLNEDLTWTQQLGEAFLSDESAVLMSVQSLRSKAQEAGHLANMDNMRVSYESNSIIIEPTTPQVVYVPYYDSRVVYGNWHWNRYPPVYWVTPKHFYPHYNSHYSARHSSHYKPFYWHSAVHIANDLFFGAVHWHNRHVVIIHHNSRSKRHYSHRPRHYNRQQIVTSHSAKRWKHKPHHRRGVSYHHKPLKRKYNQKISTTVSHSLSHRNKSDRFGYGNKKAKSRSSFTYDSGVINSRKLSKVHVNKHETRKKSNIRNKQNTRSTHSAKKSHRKIGDKNNRHVSTKQRESVKHYKREKSKRSQHVRTTNKQHRNSSHAEKSRKIKSNTSRQKSSGESRKKHARIAKNNYGSRHGSKQGSSTSRLDRKHH